MKKFSIIYFAFSFTLLFGQVGENVYPFLNLPISPRQAALGGDAISIMDQDVNFASVNPANLNEEMDRKISANYAFYLADTRYGTVNYSHTFRENHYISGNLRFMDFGKIPRTDEAGFVNGEFGASDVSLGVGYAYHFEEDWAIGARVDMVSSKIDNYTSVALAGTVGLTYRIKKTKETIGLVARNFGYQFKSFNGLREDLPFRLDFGYTKILEKLPVAFTITAHNLQQFNTSAPINVNGQEIGFGRKIMDHLSFGAELFPEKPFIIRLGYNIKRGNELSVVDQRSFAGLSFGFGMKLNAFRIDYAHARYHNAANMNMLGVSLDMSRNRYYD